MIGSTGRLGLLLVGAIGCAPRAATTHDVLIKGAEYTFIHPDTLMSGPTAFRFANVGKVSHEMSLGRLKPGATLAQVLAAGPKGGELFQSWGAILTAEPGDTVPAQVLIDLPPGATYVLWCGFHDSAGAPAHGTLGMTGSMTVR